jgi:hypothetical protein
MTTKLILIFTFIIIVNFISAQEKVINDSEVAKQLSLSTDQIAAFKEYTRQKIEEFQQHIIIIGDKDQPSELRNMAEQEVLKLFYKGAEMEISTYKPDGNVEIISRPIEKYIARLKALPFTRVVIKFYDIAYITDFIQGADGKYYSTATILQKFTGFTGDQIQYSDVTKKEIEIIIDLVEDKFFKEKHWKIFLGNIRATETKKTLTQFISQ